MSYFNEDNVTERMCINVAEKVEIDIFLDELHLRNRNFM